MKKFRIRISEDRSGDGPLRLVRVETIVEAETREQAKKIAKQKSGPFFDRFISSCELNPATELPVFKVSGYWNLHGASKYMTLIVSAINEKSAIKLVKEKNLGYENSSLTASKVNEEPGIIAEY